MNTPNCARDSDAVLPWYAVWTGVHNDKNDFLFGWTRFYDREDREGWIF